MLALLLIVLLFLPAWADPAETLLVNYGWRAQGPPVLSSLKVPDSLSGLPFTHYQSASQAIGLDLAPARGKKIFLERYTLSRKTGTGASIYAHIATLDERIVGAWLSTDAPVAPGIGPLSEGEFGSDW